MQGIAMQGQGMLQWRSCTGCSPAVPRPLVVLLPWVWASPQHLKKYVQLCHAAGWDVLLVRWPMLAMWAPPWSMWLAGRVLQEVGASLSAGGERPVVFWVFSGAAKGVYSSLLKLLAGRRRLSPQQALLSSRVQRCSVGQIFDSSPVDFTSSAGKKLLQTLWNSSSSNTNNADGSSAGSSSSGGGVAGSVAAAQAAAAAATEAAAAAGADVAAGVLDFFLLERFQADRDDMWTALRNPPIRGPVLFLYSRADQLADAAQVSGLAAALRLRGHQVLEQVWQDSGHVGHLRAHGPVYSDCLHFLLSQALQEWANSSSSLQEGQRLAAAWQQQQQPPGSSGGSSGGGCAGAAAAGDEAGGYAGTAVGGSAVRSSVAAEQQQQRRQQQQCGGGRSEDAGQQCLHQQNHQQQHLMLQPARGIFSFSRGTGKAGHGDSSSSTCAGGTSSSSSSSSMHGSCHCFGDGISAAAAGAAASDFCLDVTVLTAGRAAPAAAAAAAAVLASRQQRQPLQDWLGAPAALHSQQQQQQIRHVDSRIVDGGAARAVSAAAAMCAAAGSCGPPSLARSCCGCSASECRCAETRAAAAGEVSVADSTTLSHSLRCLVASSTLQRQYIAAAAAIGHRSGGGAASSSSGSSRAGNNIQQQQQQQQQPSMAVSNVPSQQQEQQRMLLMQRLALRLRSRL